MWLFKTPVTIPMFTFRLTGVFDFTSRTLRDVVGRTDRSTPTGQKFCEAVGDHVDAVIAFAMQFSVISNLRREQAEPIVKSLALHAALVTAGEDKYFFERFADIPSGRRTPMVEYLMVGNTFLSLCGGKTGVQELDDLIRQFGADTFMKVCEITKKEIKGVRLQP